VATRGISASPSGGTWDDVRVPHQRCEKEHKTEDTTTLQRSSTTPIDDTIVAKKRPRNGPRVLSSGVTLLKIGGVLVYGVVLVLCLVCLRRSDDARKKSKVELEASVAEEENNFNGRKSEDDFDDVDQLLPRSYSRETSRGYYGSGALPRVLGAYAQETSATAGDEGSPQKAKSESIIGNERKSSNIVGDSAKETGPHQKEGNSITSDRKSGASASRRTSQGEEQESEERELQTTRTATTTVFSATQMGMVKPTGFDNALYQVFGYTGSRILEHGTSISKTFEWAGAGAIDTKSGDIYLADSTYHVINKLPPQTTGVPWPSVQA